MHQWGEPERALISMKSINEVEGNVTCNTWPETTADWTLKSHRPHSPLQSCTQVIYSIHVADRQVLVVDVVGYRR